MAEPLRLGINMILARTHLGGEIYVMASDYDALAARLAEAERLLAEAERLLVEGMDAIGLLVEGMDAIEGNGAWKSTWDAMRLFLYGTTDSA